MRHVAAALALSLVAACGSTAQVQSSGAAGDGLTAPDAPATQGATFAPGMAPPGGAAPATGATRTGPSAPATQQPGPRVTGSLVPRTASAVTGSLQLGFMTTTVGNAQSFGINVGQTFSDQQLYDALVKEINARGGLAGRKIVPVYGATDTASSDWSVQFEAACSKLTEDHKVQAVLGYIFVFLDSFEQCLARAHVPHFYGGYQPGDVQAQNDFPSITSTAHPSVEVSNQTVLEGAVKAGRLTSKTKLGIIIDDCAHGLRAFAGTSAPYLKQHGISYELVQMDCASGSGDVGAAAAAIKSAELQFSTHGVDTVYTSGVALLLFMQNAESQGYRPSYLTSLGGAIFEPNAPARQLANVHGFGWLPAIDVNPSHQPYALTAAQKSCLGMLRHQGLTPKAYNDFMFAYISCDALSLYGQALQQTGGRTTPSLVQAAVLKLMPSFRGAATYGGGLAHNRGQRGGPSTYREWGWTKSCSCFTYRGATHPVPSLA